MANNEGRNRRLIERINAHQEAMRALSDSELRGKTGEFRDRVAQGEPLDRLLPEAYAAVREADLRVVGKFPYENQLLAAIVMHQGNIAAMKTGEGKSLTATLPLYLNALTGRGVILVTVNGYLARRDAEEFRPVFEFMGLSLAVAVPEAGAPDFTATQKKANYAADVVYTTSDKLGFDYLLENLVGTSDEKYLRPFNYVLIDEADAVLLDLAQMPLVISGSPRVQSNLYPLAAEFVATLREDSDFEYDESTGAVKLTDDGIAAGNRYFHLDNLYAPEYFQLNRHVYLALRARTGFQAMRDYMAMGGNLVLLSSVTGRLLEGNKLQGGLHQAIEAREGLEITTENRAMASVTYQNLFLMFETMGGMTGTARGSEKELLTSYGTEVVEIPTYRPVIRQDEPDVVLASVSDKERRILDYVDEVRHTGRPILLTTGSVKSSVTFSQYLLDRGIEHNLLNALSEAKEAEMVREAGRRGAITVATLIAGRGTDIKLTDESKELGGLVIIGTEKLPNRRVEGQVRGRSGRQGDPGSSRFYASLEDDIFVRFGSIKHEDLHKRRRSPSTMSRLLDRAQRASEDSASGARKLSKDFDVAMSRQRDLVYALRNQIITGAPITRHDLQTIAAGVLTDAAAGRAWQKPGAVMRYVFDNLSYRLPAGFDTLDTGDDRKVHDFLSSEFARAVQDKADTLADPDVFARFQNIVFLKAIDVAWIEQVDFLEQLKTVVQDRNVAQHKVEYEYRREAYFAFEEMKKRINRDIVRLLCLSRIEHGADGGLVIQFA
ncbi:accessory Sec system translocase SecA2 [Gryllotalpicola protaetiae]|uniref:Protein translocase subunit SecA n=1 Tax=Gryllotalpicola protaetiae TaxID=2419771 RepID=A0A387BVL2_9MICO|nr:accessory Sec system translocase SecA2 [Gryllotalpicola protaetiae]AYG05166.1 accessory Sec system translocase SecA2 [Gryllotalpicola protaetiae]